MKNPNTLRISEIFLSLQGESTLTGLPTVFIRLTGCPLRCTYCDTAYAFHGGKTKSFDEIIGTIVEYGVRHVTITGGEPLAQASVFRLMTALCDLNLVVSLETSGALPIEPVDSRVIKVMDLKTPSSGECEKNDYENIQHLKPNDQIKFVIGTEEDYLWSKQAIETHELNTCCELLFSPSYQALHPKQLADWILEDRLPVRFQMQLHKLIWGEVAGR